MKINIMKIFMIVGLLLFLTGCEKKVDIDNEALKLIDTYLNDEKVKAFHQKLKVSRENVIEDFEQRYKETFFEDINISLEYDKKTYDPDFENNIEVKISTKQPVRVIFKTPFADDLVSVDKQTSKFYKVIGISQENLNVELVKILPPTDEYKTKNYAR
ncbi:MAG: hypothetical protein M0P43_04165 [Arcobacteraceae bacterium]|nr:hypothetical protein [Arcobacteraceae bacterium]MDY0328135.1 hypothetical protein [Arcobacteraceae bacterium]